jgi:hypothetical protein
VSRDQDAAPFRRITGDPGGDLRLSSWIDSACRLVEDEKIRLRHRDDSEFEALALAARKVAGMPFARPPQIHAVESSSGVALVSLHGERGAFYCRAQQDQIPADQRVNEALVAPGRERISEKGASFGNRDMPRRQARVKIDACNP